MRRNKVLLAVVIIVVLVSSSLLAVWTFFPDGNGSSDEFYVGVQLGYGGVDDCKAMVDKVKGYTNLFVISSYEVTKNDTVLNEMCDYLCDAELSFIIHFEYTYVNYHYSTKNWTIQAKETYGDHYLGEYFLDEMGGKQLDMGYPHIGTSYNSYTEAADDFVKLLQTYAADLANSGGQDFTADYALYWFDYKAGFDTVFAEFGWNQSRQLQISQCRGAADVQNKDWGAILTWTYNHPPYLESGPELYDDLLLAYHSGAKYAVVFNYAKDTPYSDYGIMTEEHFEALENFWTYKNDNPKKQGCLIADVAFVLPQDYAFGFRDANDRVWIQWKEYYSADMWNQVNDLLDEYGSRLDIVYADPEFNDRIEENYKTILTWEFESAEGFPVRNINTSIGYSTIQAAINSGFTLDGHVIYVTAGTYYENVVVNKSVALIGEDRKTTIIDGGNAASTVHITSSANVTGFTIRNGDASEQANDTFSMGEYTMVVDNPSYCGAGILVDWPNCCITGNDVSDNNYGICIRSSGNITLNDNSISDNDVNLMVDGDLLSHFINNIDTLNTVDGKMVYYRVNEENVVIDSSFSDIGFLALINCTNMTVQSLSLDNNGQGIVLVNTTDSTVTGNIITNNQDGIRLLGSSSNVFRDNTMNNNAYSLWIQDGLANDIDTSNTVDSRPIIYWVNQQTRTVPSDAGYVALINCTNIVAQNLDISSNRQGVLLVSTTDSSIMESNLSNNHYGVQLEDCSDITINGNCIENNKEFGIYLQQSSNNIISNNALLKSRLGIQIGNHKTDYDDTNPDNQIIGNTIKNNIGGIRFAETECISIFYHNSLINNTQQIDFRWWDDSANASIFTNWDNGFEGNYWSDYIGNDTNHDGILDAEYQVLSRRIGLIMHETGHTTEALFTITDRYPLSGTFSSH